MNRIAITAIAAALLATGCATPRGKYQCSAPDGVSCMSMLELYEATETRSRVVGNTAPTETPVVIRGDSLGFAGAAGYAVPDLPAQVPVRAPAKVMRIWFAPWQDDDGDLVMAAHVFSEIEPRRWSVGQDGIDTIHATRPFRVTAPQGSATP